MTGQSVARIGLKKVYSMCVHNKPGVIELISGDNWSLMVEILHMEHAKCPDVPATTEKPTFEKTASTANDSEAPLAKRRKVQK